MAGAGPGIASVGATETRVSVLVTPLRCRARPLFKGSEIGPFAGSPGGWGGPARFTPILANTRQAESEGFFPVAVGQVDPASTRWAGRALSAILS